VISPQAVGNFSIRQDSPIGPNQSNGPLTIFGDFTCFEASALSTLSLPSLVTITGNIKIGNVPSLTAVDFNNVTTIEGDLYLENLPALAFDTKIFEKLAYIRGNILILGDFDL
jgi:hypothetical protein